MIFPANLSVVTFYLEGLDEYHELDVASSQMGFQFETFYLREAISAKKRVKFSGVRYSMSLTYEQTRQHDKVRAFYGRLLEETADDYPRVRLYFVTESSIDEETDYIDVSLGSVNAFLNYRNQVRRHYYTMSFDGQFPEVGLGLAYIIDNSGNFVFNNEGRRIFASLNPFA